MPRKAAPRSAEPRRRVSRSATRRPLRVGLDSRGRTLLIVGAVALVCAYLFRRSELLYIGTLLMGLPIVALVTLRFRRRRLGVSRRFSPAIAEAGRPVGVKVAVRNLGSTRTGEAMWRDVWPWPPFGNAPTRLRALPRRVGVTGTASTTVSYVLEPRRRGVFDIGPFVVEVSDPFRLAWGEVTLGSTQKLIVTPRVADLPITSLSIAAQDGSDRAQRRLHGGGGDDLMTREYRHGDPMRRVHWKASARQGELMVRQEEQRSHAQARVVLDTHRSGYRDAGFSSSDEPESGSFEWAVSFTASLCFHLQRIGFTVEVIETGYPQLVQPEHHHRFLGSLAEVELVDGSHQRGFLSLPPAVGRSLGSVFAIVADAEPHTVERLLAQRAQFDTALAFVLNPHNDVVLGALRDAGWMCVIVHPTDDLADVWRAAAELREAHRGSS